MDRVFTFLGVIGLLVFTVTPFSDALGLDGWTAFLFALSYGLVGGAAGRALSNLAEEF